MILDLDGNKLTSYSYSQESGSTQIFAILVECETGYKLTSESIARLVVEGREGEAGAWIDLESVGIDLSSNDGLTVEYQIRTTAPTVTVPSRDMFKLIVAK